MSVTFPLVIPFLTNTDYVFMECDNMMINLPNSKKQVGYYAIYDGKDIVGFGMQVFFKEKRLQEIAMQDWYIAECTKVKLIPKVAYNNIVKRLNALVDYKWYDDDYEIDGCSFDLHLEGAQL